MTVHRITAQTGAQYDHARDTHWRNPAVGLLTFYSVHAYSLLCRPINVAYKLPREFPPPDRILIDRYNNHIFETTKYISKDADLYNYILVDEIQASVLLLPFASGRREMTLVT